MIAVSVLDRRCWRLHLVAASASAHAPPPAVGPAGACSASRSRGWVRACPRGRPLLEIPSAPGSFPVVGRSSEGRSRPSTPDAGPLSRSERFLPAVALRVGPRGRGSSEGPLAGICASAGQTLVPSSYDFRGTGRRSCLMAQLPWHPTLVGPRLHGASRMGPAIFGCDGSSSGRSARLWSRGGVSGTTGRWAIHFLRLLRYPVLGFAAAASAALGTPRKPLPPGTLSKRSRLLVGPSRKSQSVLSTMSLSWQGQSRLGDLHRIASTCGAHAYFRSAC